MAFVSGDVVLRTFPENPIYAVGIVVERSTNLGRYVVCRFWDPEYKVWNSTTVNHEENLTVVGSLYDHNLTTLNINNDMDWNTNKIGAARRAAARG